MRKNVIWGIAWLVISALGCSSESQTYGRLRVINTTKSLKILEVNLVDASKFTGENWGANQLLNPIAPGGSHEFNMKRTVYNLRIQTTNDCPPEIFKELDFRTAGVFEAERGEGQLCTSVTGWNDIPN